MEFSRVEIISGMSKVNELIEKFGQKSFIKKLNKLGLTVSNVLGCGVQLGSLEYEEDTNSNLQLLPKSKIMIICEKSNVDGLIKLIEEELYTGHIGDGKIFVSGIDNIYRVRTGEEGVKALNKSELD